MSIQENGGLFADCELDTMRSKKPKTWNDIKTGIKSISEGDKREIEREAKEIVAKRDKEDEIRSYKIGIFKNKILDMGQSEEDFRLIIQLVGLMNANAYPPLYYKLLLAIGRNDLATAHHCITEMEKSPAFICDLTDALRRAKESGKLLGLVARLELKGVGYDPSIYSADTEL